MRKIIVSQFVTVDNVMEGPGPDPGFDRSGWAFRFDSGDEGRRFKLEEVLAAGALLLGRVTYGGFAAVWPTMTDEAGFADKMNSMPKYVVSSTLSDPEWTNTTVINGNVAEEIAELKRQPGGDILVNGSAQLVRTLAEHALVDEYRLMVHPIVLGAGKRLFGDISNTSALRLVDTKPVGPDGIVVMTYRPAGNNGH